MFEITGLSRCRSFEIRVKYRDKLTQISDGTQLLVWENHKFKTSGIRDNVTSLYYDWTQSNSFESLELLLNKAFETTRGYHPK